MPEQDLLMTQSNFQDKRITDVVKKLRRTINESLSLIGQKMCVKCNVAKPVSDFTKSNQQRDGLFPYCKECSRKCQEETRRKRGIKPKRGRTVYELPQFKVCTKCNKELPKDAFRIRWDKKNDKKYPYLNPSCKDCDARMQMDRWKAQRATQEGRENHNRWAKEFHQRHREKCCAKMRERRKSPEYKAYMKEYRERNKEKIREQEVITKKRYHEKHRDNITDKYCIRQLISQGLATKENITPELIELERQKILLTRIKLKIKTHGKQNQKS